MRHSLALLACVLLASTSLPAAKPVVSTSVIATFNCPTTFACASDGIQGDASGALVGNAATGKGAFLGPGGALIIRLDPALGRSLWIAFSSPADAPPCGASCRKNFDAATVDDVDAFSVHPVRTDGTDLVGGFDALSPGQTVPARIKFNFQDPAGRRYLFTLHYGAVTHAGSSFVLVTRTSPSEWKVEAPVGATARLLAINQSGKLLTTDEGLYENQLWTHRDAAIEAAPLDHR